MQFQLTWGTSICLSNYWTIGLFAHRKKRTNEKPWCPVEGVKLFQWTCETILFAVLFFFFFVFFSRALPLQGVTLPVTLWCRPSIRLSVCGRTPLPPMRFLGSSGNFNVLNIAVCFAWWLPGGNVTAGQMLDGSSFDHVSFVLIFFFFFVISPLFGALWWSHVLVWWLFPTVWQTFLSNGNVWDVPTDRLQECTGMCRMCLLEVLANLWEDPAGDLLARPANLRAALRESTPLVWFLVSSFFQHKIFWRKKKYKKWLAKELWSCQLFVFLKCWPFSEIAFCAKVQRAKMKVYFTFCSR